MNKIVTKTDIISRIKAITTKSGFGLICAFIVVFVALSFASESFLTLRNIFTMLNQSSFIAIIAMGMTLVIAMGGIDLSVGAILSLTGLLLGDMLLRGVNVYLAILITLVIGFFIGFINGILITKAKITDFIATLATLTIMGGIVLVYTKGLPFFGLEWPQFAWFGQGVVLGIQVPLIIAGIIAVIFYFITYKTRFGRHTISIGSNTDAAKLVGIQVDKIKILVYCLSGLLSALTGILIASRVSTAMPNAGVDYNLKVIAAVVIGGTSLAGGKANIPGALIGAVLMIMVSNGLTILNINSNYQNIVLGIIILLAVGSDVFSSRRSKMA